VSPSSRKTFRRYLAKRRQRLRHRGLSAAAGLGPMPKPSSFAFALGAPAGFLLLYVLLRRIDVFSPLDPRLPYVWAALFVLWILFALRGAIGFWPRWGHTRFAVLFVLAVGFGSCWGTNGSSGVKAWVTPPPYARLPATPLEDKGEVLDVLAGSYVHISQPAGADPSLARFGEEEETFEGDSNEESTRSFAVPQATKVQKVSLLLRRGWHRLGSWTVRVVPDEAPRVAFTDEPSVTTRKTIRFAFDASDDYGVESVSARIAPTVPMPNVNNEPVDVVLSRPGVKQMRGAGYADLTQLPWAGASVTVQLIAKDGAGHESFSATRPLLLPVRAFRNPFARALIEERQKLLGQPDAAVRDEVANVMAGVARQQGLYHGDAVVLMTLRAGAVRLVLMPDEATVRSARQVLWETAVRLEEGSVGRARAELANAQQDLSIFLLRDARPEEITPYLAHMKKALKTYFAALDDERLHQPPSLQEVDWPLSTLKEVLTPEDLQNQLASIEALLDAGSFDEAEEKLAYLQDVFENLRTTPPDLTPEQYRLVEQTSSLRALVRSQKKVSEDSEKLITMEHKSPKGRDTWRAALAHVLTQQQVLGAALADVVQKIDGEAARNAKAGARAMGEAIASLQKQDVVAAQQKQAEALGIIENSLLSLSERMRQALTAQAP